jgi:oxygen-independent coproporphyrinogen-3 oxidase
VDTSVPISSRGQPLAQGVPAARTVPGSHLPTAAAALLGAGLGQRPPVRSLYIHTPFCVHKCDYCDFYSFVDTKDQQAAFTERLLQELVALAPHAAGAPLRTIFVGGGTPSLLRPELWARLLACLDDHYDLALIRAQPPAGPTAQASGPGPVAWPSSEFTVECNPESATSELMGVLRSGGVDRVSMGAQSFVPRHLQTLQRLHEPARVALAVQAARAAGIPRVSIDLIYAIPSQTLDEWASDLRTALALGITHLSCYNLAYEPGTGLTNRLKRGQVTPVDEDLEAEMFELTSALLEPAGLRRYEVSNYAQPGHESRHNLAYWLQEQWLAAGPSASGHIWAGPTMLAGSHRTKNVGSLAAYLAHSASGLSPLADHEPPSPPRALRERLMTALRLAIGLDATALLRDAGHLQPASVPRLESAARELAGDGLLIDEPPRPGEAPARCWRVTPRGWLIADFVAKRLMKCVEA